MKKRLVLLIWVSSLILLNGCGGGSASPKVTVVPPPPATNFSVVAQDTSLIGSSFTFTVKALDASSNVVTSYSGTVNFTSTDPLALLPPAHSSLTNGTGTFQATLKTAGNQTITATDAVSPLISGTSNSLNIVGLLAIASSAPPSGAFGVPYGKAITEHLQCFLSPVLGWHLSCVPCYQRSCYLLPPCNSAGFRNPFSKCLETKTVFPGFPLASTGGLPSYTWTLQSGSSLPPGLNLISYGLISGTPATAGTYNVGLTVTDSASPPDQVMVSYQIAIAPPPPPIINLAPLPAIGTLNSPYVGYTFTATSPATPLTWSSSPSPQGMSFSAGGVLFGTPTQAGSFPITVNAVDTQGQNTSPQTFTIEVLAKGFVPTGSLQTSRVFHTATLLGDGNVLITGGVNDSAFPTTAELYDSTSGKFALTTGSLTGIRFSATATLLKNGKVLLIGGKGSNSVLATAEIYDSATQTFAATSGNMSTERVYHVATMLNDGTVLVTGGLNAAGGDSGTPVSSAEIYDPSTDSFTLTGPMTTGRFFHTATLLVSGKVLITGGLDAGAPLASAELYDPVAKTFSPAGNMTLIRMGHTATLLGNGKLLLTGGGEGFGGNATNTAELYDPATDSFTATNPMVNPRSLHTATLLNTGQVLVAGGASAFYGTGQSYSVSSAELFDPTTGNFTATADMTAIREGHTATRLQTGDVLVVGGADGTLGYSPTTNVLSTAELYH